MQVLGKVLSIALGVKRPHGNDNVNVLVPVLLLWYVPIKERSTAVQGLVVLSTVSIKTFAFPE